jgi:hypothetical protein
MVIDPKTVDLMWELHADLGSKAPIHIICGYRSASTNAMLKKIGRNVAKQSMHIRGKAIDLYFPDVPVSKIRGSAIVRQAGGVGYYPRSGVSGFVHIDSGNVRYWPRPDASQMAEIFRDFRNTVGARMTNGYMVAQADPGPDASVKKGGGAVQMAAADFGSEDESDDEPARVTASLAKGKLGVEVAAADPVPRPRSRPIEVMFLASMQVEPASAPAPRINFAKRSPQFESLGDIAAGEDIFDTELSSTNSTAKGSLAGFATASVSPPSVTTTGNAEDSPWWLVRWLFNTDSLIRRDHAKPLEISYTNVPAEVPARTMVIDGIGLYLASSESNSDENGPSEAVSSGKSDMLVVNRSTKGDTLEPAVLDYDQLGSAGDVLDGGASPLRIQ